MLNDCLWFVIMYPSKNKKCRKLQKRHHENITEEHNLGASIVNTEFHNDFTTTYFFQVIYNRRSLLEVYLLNAMMAYQHRMLGSSDISTRHIYRTRADLADNT